MSVSWTGTGDRVMTSPDGITWTSRNSAADNNWLSVTYGEGLFVAVSFTGMGDRVMTSPNGITWNLRSAADNEWYGVTYGDGKFVAVSYSGSGNRVMTWRPYALNTNVQGDMGYLPVSTSTPSLKVEGDSSVETLTISQNNNRWISRRSSSDTWWSVMYGSGAGLFVAVASSGSVMTSPNGIVWTGRQSAASHDWRSLTYGNGVFVATARSGVGTRVMTSLDGITWMSRQTPADNNWDSVTFGNGVFVSVANSGTGNRVMTSPDGITWTIQTGASNNSWRSVTYGTGPGLFVAVASSGGVMSSLPGWRRRIKK